MRTDPDFAWDPDAHPETPEGGKAPASVAEAVERTALPPSGLTTPTGVLVTDAEPETEEWFAARREGITATDLPKILGLSKYGNALSVWLDKRGELEDTAGEAAVWGNLLEDLVAQEWARRHGTLVTRVGILANVNHPWQRASLDRLVEPGMCPDRDSDCGLQVKTRSAFKAGSFKTEVPDDVLAQEMWELLVTGLDHMHVAVLIGGQELRSFRIDRDEKIMAYLIEQAEPVWQAVQEGFPPAVEPDFEGVLLDLLNRVYGDRSGDRELDPSAVELVEEYRLWTDQEKEAKRNKTRIKTALVQMLDDGDTGVIDGEPIFTYKAPVPTDAMPADEVRRLAQESPEIYEALRSDGFIQPTTPGPRFTLATRKEKE